MQLFLILSPWLAILGVVFLAGALLVWMGG
jgi:hypothetical protein